MNFRLSAVLALLCFAYPISLAAQGAQVAEKNQLVKNLAQVATFGNKLSFVLIPRSEEDAIKTDPTAAYMKLSVTANALPKQKGFWGEVLKIFSGSKNQLLLTVNMNMGSGLSDVTRVVGKFSESAKASDLQASWNVQALPSVRLSNAQDMTLRIAFRESTNPSGATILEDLAGQPVVNILAPGTDLIIKQASDFIKSVLAATTKANTDAVLDLGISPSIFKSYRYLMIVDSADQDKVVETARGANLPEGFNFSSFSAYNYIAIDLSEQKSLFDRASSPYLAGSYYDKLFEPYQTQIAAARKTPDDAARICGDMVRYGVGQLRLTASDKAMLGLYALSNIGYAPYEQTAHETHGCFTFLELETYGGDIAWTGACKAGACGDTMRALNYWKGNSAQGISDSIQVNAIGVLLNKNFAEALNSAEFVRDVPLVKWGNIRRIQASDGYKVDACVADRGDAFKLIKVSMELLYDSFEDNGRTRYRLSAISLSKSAEETFTCT